MNIFHFVKFCWFRGNLEVPLQVLGKNMPTRRLKITDFSTSQQMDRSVRARSPFLSVPVLSVHASARTVRSSLCQHGPFKPKWQHGPFKPVPARPVQACASTTRSSLCQHGPIQACASTARSSLGQHGPFKPVPARSLHVRVRRLSFLARANTQFLQRLCVIVNPSVKCKRAMRTLREFRKLPKHNINSHWTAGATHLLVFSHRSDSEQNQFFSVILWRRHFAFFPRSRYILSPLTKYLSTCK